MRFERPLAEFDGAIRYRIQTSFDSLQLNCKCFRLLVVLSAFCLYNRIIDENHEWESQHADMPIRWVSDSLLSFDISWSLEIQCVSSSLPILPSILQDNSARFLIGFYPYARKVHCTHENKQIVLNSYWLKTHTFWRFFSFLN